MSDERTNIITQWIDAVINWLKTQPGFIGAEFLDEPYPPDTGQAVSRRDKVLVAVWLPRYPQVDRDIALASPALTIRVFPGKPKTPSAAQRGRAHELRQAASDLMIAMEQKRKSGDFIPNLACHLSDVGLNYRGDAWYAEAAIQSVTLNLAARGA